MVLFRIAIFSFFAVFLVACSQEGDDAGLGDLTKYDNTVLRKMIDDGDVGTVEAVIRARDKQKIATIADYLLLADIYNDNFNGVAAEVAVEKARFAGAIQSFTAVKMAKALLLQQKFDNAEAELATVQLTGKDGFESLFIQGEIAVGREDFGTARRYYNLASEIDPEDLRAYLALSVLELAEGNIDAAKENAEAVVKRSENNSMASYMLGAVARLQGRQDDALQLLNKAIETNPGNALALIELGGLFLDLKRFEEVQNVVDKILAISPNNAIARYYLAYLQVEEGNAVAAEDILLRTGDLIRAYLPATLLYGRVQYAQGKYEGALQYLKRSIEVFPDNRTIRLALVDSLQQTGQAKEALAVLEPLSQYSEADAAVMAQAGAVNAALGNFDEASKNYAKAAEIASVGVGVVDDDFVASVQIREALVQYGSGRTEDGIAIMERLTAGDNATADQLTTLANMHLAAGNMDAAMATAAKLKIKNPESALAFNIVGSAEYRKNNYDAAILAFSKALEIDPDYPSALKNRAATYMAQEKYELARIDLVKVVPSATQDGQVLGMLGIANAELGNFGDAVRALTDARKLIPASARFAAYHAYSLGSAGYFEEAIKEAKVAQKLAPKNTELAEQLAGLIKQYEAAVEKDAGS